MPHDSTTTGRGPWRILVLDRDHSDPKWLLATIAPGDVRPVTNIESVTSGAVDEVTARWVAARHGPGHVALTPLPRAHVWRIDEHPESQ